MEVQKEDQRDPDEKVVEIEIERLRDFKNHPFKVQADSQMKELQESIKKYGILNPLIVRPRPEGFYEIISGHRRKYAAQQLKYTKENCFLCGSNRPGIFDYYKKSGCIALVCLNTWNIADTNVYEYDNNGKIVEEPNGFSTNINTHGENECSWMVAGDPVRHTATATLTYGDNSVLDPERLSAQLCQDCLKKVADAVWPTGYEDDWTYHCDVLMNMETEDIYPISSTITRGSIGDFWLHLDH